MNWRHSSAPSLRSCTSGWFYTTTIPLPFPIFTYLSLSPIFDSISKQGYHSAFTAEDIAKAYEEGIIDHRVMALGGITFDKLQLVKQMGFGGAMILGDAWK